MQKANKSKKLIKLMAGVLSVLTIFSPTSLAAKPFESEDKLRISEKFKNGGIFMARLLRETDIKPALKLVTRKTKNLVIAGVNGDNDYFPKFLANYIWTGTRDYNMALIIIAFYAYCTKSEVPDLKKFGFSALRKGSSSNKMFEVLREGDGKQVKYYMGSYFQAALDTVLKEALPNDEGKRAKIIKSFINQAGKITPWKINGQEISNVIDRLIGSAAKEANKAMMQKEAEDKREELYDEKLKKLKEERYDELKQLKTDVSDIKEVEKNIISKACNEKLIKERYDELGKIKPDDKNKARIKQIFESEAAYTKKLEELKKEIYDELKKVKSDFTTEKKEAAKNTIKFKSPKKRFEDACRIDDLETVKQMIESDPSISKSYGESVLTWAAYEGRISILDLLLTYGVNPNTSSDTRMPPLHAAVQYNHREIVELLINKGADPNICAHGVTPLHTAVMNNSREIVELLLKQGANPNIQDIQVILGCTPLHVAALKGQRKIYDLLIEHGADPDIKNNKGMTPKEIMERNTKK